MAKPTSYSILVYQEQHLAAVPKPQLKKVIKELVRKARLQVGTYILRVNQTSTSSVHSQAYRRVAITKGDRLDWLKVTIQLSPGTGDTYSGTLQVPMQVVTHALVESLVTAATALNCNSMLSVTRVGQIPAVPVVEHSKLTPQQIEPTAVSQASGMCTEDVQFTDDSIMQSLKILESQFHMLIQALRGLLLLPRRAQPRPSRVIRAEFASALQHLHDLPRLREVRKRQLMKKQVAHA